MGLIDIIKPLSIVLASAVNKSRQHQEKIFLNAKNRTRATVLYIIALLCCSCTPEDDLRVPPGQHEGPRHHQPDGHLLEGAAHLQPAHFLRQLPRRRR